METEKQKIDVNFLAHYGTEGMRWGVRRYQNTDGSLTPEGRKHWGVGPPRKKSKSFRLETADERKKRLELKAEKKAEKAEAKAIKTAEKIAKKKIDLINKGDRAEIYKNRKLFTDDELDYVQKRLEKTEKIVGGKIPDEKKQKILNRANPEELYKNRNLFTDEELRSAVQRYENAKKLKDSEKKPDNVFKKAILAKGDADEIYANRHLFTDDELRSAIQRLENTQKIKQMTTKEREAAEKLKTAQQNNNAKNDGKSFVKGLTEAGKDLAGVATVAASLYGAYNQTAAIVNEVSGKKTMPVFKEKPWEKPQNKSNKKFDPNNDMKDSWGGIWTDAKVSGITPNVQKQYYTIGDLINDDGITDSIKWFSGNQNKKMQKEYKSEVVEFANTMSTISDILDEFGGTTIGKGSADWEF